jgi:4-hydroxy-tetrahydrodipicolinate synthase
MKERGVLNSDICRHPIPSLEENSRKGLIRLAKKYNPIALHWGK